MFFPKDICIADFKANEENAGFGGDRVYYPSREWGDCDELNHVGSIGSYRKLAGPGDGRTTWIGFRSVAEAKSSNSQGGSFASVGEIDCDLRVLRWGKRLCKSYTFYRKPRSLIQMKTLDRGIERPHGGCLRSNPCTFCNASLSLKLSNGVAHTPIDVCRTARETVGSIVDAIGCVKQTFGLLRGAGVVVAGSNPLSKGSERYYCRNDKSYSLSFLIASSVSFCVSLADLAPLCFSPLAFGSGSTLTSLALSLGAGGNNGA